MTGKQRKAVWLRIEMTDYIRPIMSIPFSLIFAGRMMLSAGKREKNKESKYPLIIGYASDRS